MVNKSYRVGLVLNGFKEKGVIFVLHLTHSNVKMSLSRISTVFFLFGREGRRKCPTLLVLSTLDAKNSIPLSTYDLMPFNLEHNSSEPRPK